MRSIQSKGDELDAWDTSAGDNRAGRASEAEPVARLLFEAASVFSSAAERDRFLDYACKGEPEMRQRIGSLFDIRSDADAFFEFEPGVEAEASGEEPGLGVGMGRYQLIERLGAGGCGVVYLAEQREPVRRKVALKTIRLGIDTPEATGRFAAEIQALAAMNHPNIARVLDTGRLSGVCPFFVMELVDGERITDYCDARRLSVQARLKLFVKVCRAIQYAHQRGVVHRDIKPSNILVDTLDSTAVPKVIDFGIASAKGALVRDEGGGLVGTPAYISPELVSGDGPVDTRSDVYSLGVLLGELVSCRPEHVPEELPNHDLEERRRILREARPELPSSLLRSRPPEERRRVAANRRVSERVLLRWCGRELDRVVEKAVHTDPSIRYATVTELAADVERWLEDEPVAACRQTRRYRFAKLVRRNGMVFGAVGLAAVGLLGGTGIATVQFFDERAARRQAERAQAAEAELREGSERRGRVSEAAVRIRYGEMDGADELLSSIPIEKTPSSLESVNVYRAVADWHLLAGRMDEAGNRLLAVAYAMASVDRTDTDSVSRHLLPAATAVCLSGDEARYDWFRRMAIDRFADTRQPVVAEQVLKACLLKAADDSVLRALRPLAERVEAGLGDPESRTSTNSDLRAWSCFSLALMNYREGRDERAVSWATRSLSHPAANPGCPVSARILLGLVEARKGRLASAAGYLASAETEAGDRLTGDLRLGGTSTGFWFDWVNVRLLLAEAGRQMESSR